MMMYTITITISNIFTNTVKQINDRQIGVIPGGQGSVHTTSVFVSRHCLGYPWTCSNGQPLLESVVVKTYSQMDDKQKFWSWC